MRFDQFNESLKEHYIKPMSTFYRELYFKKFNEEAPEDMNVVLDRLLTSGYDDMEKILNHIRNG